MPFRFENMWLEVEEFKYMAGNWWVSYTVRGLYGHILATKLKVLKQDLKTWNGEVCGNATTNTATILNQIVFWDAKGRETVVSDEENEARRKAMEEYSKWATMEDISQRQKSREL